MSAITGITGVMARIGAIESRLGVARPAPTTTAAPTDSVISTTPVTPITPTTIGAAPAAAFGAAPAAPAASFGEVFEQVRAGTDGLVGAGTPYAELFNAAGAQHGVPPRVLAAIGYVESRYRTDAVSSAGAVGMMQFLPSTAASMGVDPTDPASAIDGAARYIRSGLDRFGNLEMAIASYNVGPGAIAAAGAVLPGSQAEKYTNAVFTATGRTS